MKQWLFLMPLLIVVIFSGIAVVKLRQTAENQELGLKEFGKSYLVGKKIPSFNLPLLGDEAMQLSDKTLEGERSIISVFASWCVSCQYEHPLLLRIAEIPSVNLYGINWHDKPQKAKDWLQKHGNPYKMVGMDINGSTAISFGITGAPETFIVDENGIVRFHVAGMLTPEILSKDILPFLLENKKPIFKNKNNGN